MSRSAHSPLKENPGRNRIIYLDNAATSWPKAPGCAEAVAETLLRPMGNPGRSSHTAGIRADRILFDLREQLADFFRVSDSSSLVFTSGTTESLNTVINGFLHSGETVITSSMEHNAVMRPLHHLAERKSLRLLKFPGDPETGFPDLKAFEILLKENKPRLVITTAASNVNGIIFPVEEICRIAGKQGIPVCVDAAQAAGETPLYPEAWGIDFLCLSGHKGLLGPSGTGGLYIRDPERLPPLKRGGTGSRSSEEIQPDFLPDKFESGTPNIPGLAGWLHSMAYIRESPLQEIKDKTLEDLVEKVRSLEGLRIIGRPETAENCGYTNVLSLVPTQKTLSGLTRILNDQGVAVRTGLHCAPGAHKSLGTLKGGGTIRFSPGRFTTSREISNLYDILKEAL